ncbi:21285_t:CDS:1, partial [Entrophospora sp. SA101]
FSDKFGRHFVLRKYSNCKQELLAKLLTRKTTITTTTEGGARKAG